MIGFLLKTTFACHKTVPTLRPLAGAAPDQVAVILGEKRPAMPAAVCVFALNTTCQVAKASYSFTYSNSFSFQNAMI